MTLAPTTAMSIAPTPSFALVPFHDTEIMAARVDADVRVPMKRFCGTLGLPWDGQRQRIERDSVLSEGASMMLVPSEGGEQQQLTLPLGLLPGFLFGVGTSRLKPELRARIDLFRRECFQVLCAHFLRPTSAPTPIAVRAPAWQEMDAAARSTRELLAQISAEPQPPVRRFLHAQLARDAARLCVEAPRLDQIEAPVSADDRLLALFGGLATLTARRVRWNHLGDQANGRRAIVLPEIERLFRKHDIDVGDVDALRDALRQSTLLYRITVETLRSRLVRNHVHAHVIAPWATGELG